MAKTDKTAETTVRRVDELRLGEMVQVMVAPGMLLVNTETGGRFEPDQATPQTVTATLLRRLRDGDLVLV